MAERLPYFAILVLFGILTGYGIYRRRSRWQVCDRAFTSKLAWASISLATATMGSIYPALWAFVSFVIYGGRLEENLPPGFSIPVILGSMLMGGVFMVVNTVYGYTEHLDS